MYELQLIVIFEEIFHLENILLHGEGKPAL